MKKEYKIGIITHYYKSQNYGGNLQAYALCKALEGLHVGDVEQICYDVRQGGAVGNKRKVSLRFLISIPLKFCKRMIGKVRHVQIARRDAKYAPQFKQRETAFLRFNEDAIKHSQAVYHRDNIALAEKEYDVFITGSDQVWNPRAVHPAYLLNFVHEKPKLSYAASIACDVLTVEQQQMFRESLTDYLGISVREEMAKILLKHLTNQEVECVLDPTLLLSREDWAEMARSVDVPEKYVFCYFLGEDTTSRNIASQYAQNHGLTLVTLPFMTGHFRKCDEDFGDVRLFDVCPRQFVFLIQHASMVFSDSFHAAVFANIFEKEYFVFPRGKGDSMGSRIHQLNALFGAEGRFCDTEDKKSLVYIESIREADKPADRVLLENTKKKSFEFLTSTLRKARDYE